MWADSHTGLFISKPPEIPLSGTGAFGPGLKIVADIFYGATRLWPLVALSS